MKFPGSEVPGFKDVMTDYFLENAPPCDLLIGGFPCQPFSIMGSGAGIHDPKLRGIVVVWILKYVKKNLPEIVILENVKGLVDRHRQVLDNVVGALERMGYVVSWRLLDSKTHGAVPCSRQRVYIVGIRRSATGGLGSATGGLGSATGGLEPVAVVWPCKVPCPALSTIIDDTGKLTDYDNYPCSQISSDTKRENLIEAVKRVKVVARKQSREPNELCVVVDLGGSKVQMGWHHAPCLTKTRGQALAFWSMQHNRPLSVRELARLQGLNLDAMKINVSRSQMGGLLGNGFTCTVMARVCAAAIQAVEGSATGGQGSATAVIQAVEGSATGGQGSATGGHGSASGWHLGGHGSSRGQPSCGHVTSSECHEQALKRRRKL